MDRHNKRQRIHIAQWTSDWVGYEQKSELESSQGGLWQNPSTLKSNFAKNERIKSRRKRWSSCAFLMCPVLSAFLTRTYLSSSCVRLCLHLSVNKGERPPLVRPSGRLSRSLSWAFTWIQFGSALKPWLRPEIHRSIMHPFDVSISMAIIGHPSWQKDEALRAKKKVAQFIERVFRALRTKTLGHSWFWPKASAPSKFNYSIPQSIKSHKSYRRNRSRQSQPKCLSRID